MGSSAFKLVSGGTSATKGVEPWTVTGMGLTLKFEDRSLALESLSELREEWPGTEWSIKPDVWFELV